VRIEPLVEIDRDAGIERAVEAPQDVDLPGSPHVGDLRHPRCRPYR